MDRLPQDPAILVSSVNMLLRDEEFDSLESLCYNSAKMLINLSLVYMMQASYIVKNSISFAQLVLMNNKGNVLI